LIELVCDLKLGLVMCDLDRERRSQARPSGLVSGQAWRAVGAPCSVVRAALYVILDPRSSGRDPSAVVLECGSVICCRRRWPVFVIRDPRSVAREPCMFLRVLVGIL
jgi:hypothetical protein